MNTECDRELPSFIPVAAWPPTPPECAENERKAAQTQGREFQEIANTGEDTDRARWFAMAGHAQMGQACARLFEPMRIQSNISSGLVTYSSAMFST